MSWLQIALQVWVVDSPKDVEAILHAKLKNLIHRKWTVTKQGTRFQGTLDGFDLVPGQIISGWCRGSYLNVFQYRDNEQICV